MDKKEESTVKSLDASLDASLDDDNILYSDIPIISFIRIGQSLEMPREIDKEELNVIPRRNILNILSKKKTSIVKGKNDNKK